MLYIIKTTNKELKKILLQQDDNDLLYHYTIYSPDLIAKKSIEYYYVVSDGKNEIKRRHYKVILRVIRTDRLRLNVKNEIPSREKNNQSLIDDA